MKKAILGIDLGTTNSAVAIVEGGKATIIQNAEGKRTTPSIVSYDKGERKVGDPAKRQAITNPQGTIHSIKRFMGKRFSALSDEQKNVPYDLSGNKNDVPVVKLDGREYTPQEISSVILQKMKKTAEDYLGYEVTKAVITVPAYFNDDERNATIEAGRIAGLEVERIINEPTAAALSYGVDKKDEDTTVLVFDCGGGTHDVSVLEISDGVFEVKSTDGDVNLGGDNFDDAIINFIVEDFKAQYGFDLSKDPMAHQRVREASEKAKIELSTSNSTDINLPYITVIDNVPQHYVVNFTRAKFEALTADLVKRTIDCAESALKASGLKKENIDEIILVGGSTRIPAVVEAIENFIGKKANKSVNPDEAVALGASIQGAVLNGTVEDVLLLDVIPLSLGIETMGGIFTKIIEANTTIPTRKSQTFSTAVDNQPSVSISVLQGERPMAKDNKSLGMFNLDGIMPAPKGVPQIEVTFDIDANGVVNVSSVDKATNKANSIRIEGGSQLSEEEITRMRAEAEANAEADAQMLNKINKINEAESLINQTERQMKEFDEKLTDEDKESLNSEMVKLRTAKESEDLDAITASIESLNAVWYGISSKLYQNESGTDSGDGFQDATVEDTDTESK